VNISLKKNLVLINFLVNLKKFNMTASFLPPILTPIVTLVFPGLMFALFFVLVEQEEVA
jgi:hypothetical protein